MNYLKHTNFHFILTCLLLFSSVVNAELKPYVAVYDIYSKGFHLGEATQVLEQLETTWRISLTSKATGLASFFQNAPSTDEQVFKMHKQKALLISAKSNNGKDEEDSKRSAYYDENGQRLFTSIGSKRKITQLNSVPSSYLLLPIDAITLKNKQAIKVSLYDEGSVIYKTMALHSKSKSQTIVEIYAPKSSEKLRYIFNHNNLSVPFKIERYKNNEITAYLELKSFN